MLVKGLSLSRRTLTHQSNLIKSGSKIANNRRFFSHESTSNGVSLSNFNKSLIFGLSAATLGATVGAFALYQQESVSAEEQKKFALDPKEFIEFPLREVIPVNHNTKIFRFDLQTPDTVVGLPVASCLVIKVPKGGADGKDVIRPYTPISSNDQKGYIDLMIKRYPNGIASNYVWELKEGEKLGMKGPIPKLAIKPNMKENIGMVAGGTGLAPMIQVAREILKNPENKTKITFLFANIAEEDILRRKELDELQAQHKGKFKVTYVLEKPPKGWKGETGYITEEMIKKHLPEANDKNLILVCGPPPMVEKISGNKAPDYSQGELKGYLKDLGFNSSQVFKF